MPKNPYTPGYDSIPPVFTGRDKEIQTFLSTLSSLSKKKSHPQDIVVWGPSGNGKTALMNWVSRYWRIEAGLRRKQVRLVRVFCTVTSSNNLRNLEFELLDGHLTYEGTIDEVAKRLATQNRRRGVLLMVDEAHHLSPLGLEFILQVAHRVRKAGAAFNFVLCGSLGLKDLLNNRLDVHSDVVSLLRLARLDFPATEKALLQPLSNEGFSFDLTEETRDRMVGMTLGHPHFIQCLGDELYRIATQWNANTVDARLLSAVTPFFHQRVYSMLDGYLSSLEASELQFLAFDIAELFEIRDPPLPSHVIESWVLSRNCLADLAAGLRAFRKLGYMWERIDGQHEPALPYFMEYVLCAMHWTRHAVRYRMSRMQMVRLSNSVF